MAKGNETARTAMTHTAGPGLYHLAADASDADVVDQLSARLDHLAAMLAMITGQGFESFAASGKDLQADYLTSCEVAAAECKQLAAYLAQGAPATGAAPH